MKKILTIIAAASMGMALGMLSQSQSTAQAAKYHQGMPKALRGKWIMPKNERWKLSNEDGVLKYFKVSNSKFIVKQPDTNDTYLSPRYKKASKGHYTVLTHYKIISTIVKGRVFKNKNNVKMKFTLKKGLLSIKGNNSLSDFHYQRIK
ncbi:hypothetical protein [Levilactobacillus yonginensis]|uniref:hypothetical protein n=1 Tax=Levilactobacillus yonginensis TaxID=1054041 RepID=UPI00345CC47B